MTCGQYDAPVAMVWWRQDVNDMFNYKYKQIMKQHFWGLLIAIFALCTPAVAQNSNHYGVTAGLAVSTAADFRSHAGFMAGVRSEFPLSSRENYLYLSPSAYIIQKGWKDEILYFGDEKDYDFVSNIYYAEIPLTVGYRHAIGSQSGVFCEAGPYFAYGLSGKREVKIPGEDYSENVFSNGLCKRFDYGLKLSAGFGFSRWQVIMSFESSVRNSRKTEWEVYNPKERTFSLGLAYFFI